MANSKPLVSIVTPSLNSGRFLKETVLSVTTQDYPHIEYLVMDGRSSDETLSILEQSNERVRYISESDHGQADAVNRGFGLTHGDIFAFLNADDMYVPGAITAIVQAFHDHPDAAAVYGEGWYVDVNGKLVARYPVESFSGENLAQRCFICQPAAFLRREAFAAIGMLDTQLRYAHDYDLWIRLAQRFRVVKIDETLATLRVHDDAKTVKETAAAMRETFSVLRRHYGYVPYNWIYGYSHHLLDGQPIATEMPRPALSSACYSLALGVRYNWRHPFRLCRDIAATARQGLP
jgi:glycosyltransferase involved in cell wall biosynthesis